MSPLSSLPEPIIDLIKSANYGQFSTLTKTGVPIDTPLLFFPEEDLSKISVATGLAYPAKAERVRRNPKVGVLFEGALAGEPAVVLIAGMGATRDTDIQSNLLKHVTETCIFGDQTIPWEVKCKAVWYWSRVLVEITPRRILWWDSPADLNTRPHRWDAPADMVFPASDPAPPGKLSAPPRWPQPPWQDLARAALRQNQSGHLSSVDEDGFPAPMRTTTLRAVDDGFLLTLPKYAPGARRGPACLTFYGRETFIGSLDDAGPGELKLVVQHALPILPMMADANETWQPNQNTKDTLMKRLWEELDRRGQPLPTVPEVMPEPTPGAKRRAARNTMLAKLPLD